MDVVATQDITQLVEGKKSGKKRSIVQVVAVPLATSR
jgi:hypothetical protein